MRRRRLRLRITVIATLLGVGVAGALDGPGETRVRRALRPQVLTLLLPEVSGAVLPGMPLELSLSWEYEGRRIVRLQLVDGPEGMALDEESAVLSWTPAEEDAGTSVTVKVRAMDGEYEDNAELQLQVASPAAVTTGVNGQILTVTETGTLQGMTFAFPQQTTVPPGNVTVESVPASQAPEEPEGVTRLTDFFRVGPVEASDGMVTVTIPARLLPTQADAERVSLYVYTDQAEDVDGPAWLALGAGRDLLADGSVSLQLRALGELSFVGMDDTPLPSASFAHSGRLTTVPLAHGAASVQVQCSPLWWGGNLWEALTAMQCTVSGDVAMTVKVHHYYRSLLFPATPLEEVVGWLAAGRQKIDDYGMTSDNAMEMVFEQMKRSVFGFVSGADDRRVVHINCDKEAVVDLKATIVHEFFHHAQARTMATGLDNLITRGGAARKWLTEGTALWFEDEVFEELDSYRLLEREPLRAFTQDGLAAHPNVSRPYSRFAFFKMVASRCPAFAVRDIFNTDIATDPSGLKRFASRLASGEWACDFEDGFGEENSGSLAAALLRYRFATTQKDDMTLLDPNEQPFRVMPYTRRALAFFDVDPTTGVMPPASAWSLNLGASDPNELLGLGGGPVDYANTEVEIRIETEGGDLWWWAGKKDTALGDGEWHTTSEKKTYVYDHLNDAEGGWIGIVNPSLDQSVKISAWVNLQTVTTIPWVISHDEVLRFQSGPTMRIRASGLAHGPVGMEIKAFPNIVEDRAYFGLDVNVPQGSTGRIVVEGTFDLWIDPPKGTMEAWDGFREWAFTNRKFYHGGPWFRAEGDASTYGGIGGNTVFMDVYHKYTYTKWDGEHTELYDRKNVAMGGLGVGIGEKRP